MPFLALSIVVCRVVSFQTKQNAIIKDSFNGKRTSISITLDVIAKSRRQTTFDGTRFNIISHHAKIIRLNDCFAFGHSYVFVDVTFGVLHVVANNIRWRGFDGVQNGIITKISQCEFLIF